MEGSADQLAAKPPTSAAHALISIWTHPRATVRSLLGNAGEVQLVVLAALAGIVNTLSRASSRNLGDKLPLSTILLVALFLGPLFGVITLYVGSILIAWTGRRMEGIATPNALRVAIAWSSVPTIATLPLWAFGIATVSGQLFTSAPPSPGAAPILLAVSLPMVVLGLWSLILAVQSVGEVQGFSAWKALGNIVLGALVLLVPAIIIGVVAGIVLPRLAK